MRERLCHAFIGMTLAGLVACGHDAKTGAAPQPPAVPDALRVGAREVVVERASAQGSQVYECATGDAGFAWKLVGPDAVLTDPAGAPMGKHYAGPTWEALDGSKVIGALVRKADAPVPGAVPWLLLSAKSTEGKGLFANVTSIQRVDTEGGVAPSIACEATQAGVRKSIPYRATYYFYATSS
ncbi:MAG TPA: DUF3455 domain-containing protein [Polyangiaceae bacterium]|jgi:hypothetical protein